MTLSATAMALLSKAAEHKDRLGEPPAKLPAAARNAVLRSLIKQGLLAELPASQEATDMVWRRAEDSAYISARITDAGFRALNLDPPEIAACMADQAGRCVDMASRGYEAADAASQAPAHAVEAADAPECAANATTAPEALPGERVAAPKAAAAPVNRTGTLRSASKMLLAAWDGTVSREMDIVAELQAPMASLREALTDRWITRASRATVGTTNTPRQNTKQSQVLALLRRDEGASGPAIVEATGWAPHTVRGFLAGLKQKGFTLETLDRVRQTSTSKQGAKGCYSVYRISNAIAG